MAVKGRMAYFSECKVEQEPLGKKKDQCFRVPKPHFFFSSLASCTVLFAKLPVFLTEIYTTITIGVSHQKLRRKI